MPPDVSIQIEDPPIARALFGDTRSAWIWLIGAANVAPRVVSAT